MNESERIEREAIEWFVRMRTTTATGSDERAFEQWLTATPDHRAAFDRVARDWSRLHQIDQWALEELARLEVGSASKPDPPRMALWFGGLAAAAATLLIGFALWPADRGEAQQFRTLRAEQRQVFLADGSRMHLNTASVADVRFTRDVREVTLTSGEGVFDVEHDRARPFVVRAGTHSIIAVGTRFAVYLDREGIEVTVLDGRVVVVPEGAAAPVLQQPTQGPSDRDDGFMLSPDQQVRIENGAMKPPREVDADAETAWREGKLVFSATPLREAVYEISRYVPGEIRVADDVPDVPVTGVLQIRGSDKMLELLSEAVPVLPVKRSSSLTVLHKKS